MISEKLGQRRLQVEEGPVGRIATEGTMELSHLTSRGKDLLLMVTHEVVHHSAQRPTGHRMRIEESGKLDAPRLLMVASAFN